MDIKLTAHEERAINSLKNLSKRWPKSLWLYSGAGTLCVMKFKEDGTFALKKHGGSDPDYVVATIDILNDGGDW